MARASPLLSLPEGQRALQSFCPHSLGPLEGVESGPLALLSPMALCSAESLAVKTREKQAGCEGLVMCWQGKSPRQPRADPACSLASLLREMILLERDCPLERQMKAETSEDHGVLRHPT